jgi:hypothetical protein
MKQYSNLKRISQEETQDYCPIPPEYFTSNSYNANLVVAFTVTAIPEEPGWEKVTYYFKKKKSLLFQMIFLMRNKNT